MFEIETLIYFLLLGGFVGVISGLFGIGGGGIIVPVLSSIFLSKGIDSSIVVHLALGTSMSIIIVTSISSVRAQQKKKSNRVGHSKTYGSRYFNRNIFSYFYCFKT